MTVYDATTGFVPVAGPTQYLTFKVGATAIRQGTAVQLSSGLLIPVAATGGGQIGVAAAYGAVGAYIPVNVDPETLYEATGDEAVTIDDIGKVCLITAESAATGVSLSNQTVVTSTATLTIGVTGNYVFQIVALPGKVTNTTTALNRKVIVKMLMSKLEPYVDAVV
jgi:hypothetical protein